MTLMLSFYSYDMMRGGILPGFSLENYAEVLGDAYFHKIFLRTFLLSIMVTVFCVLLGTPRCLHSASYEQSMEVSVHAGHSGPFTGICCGADAGLGNPD